MPLMDIDYPELILMVLEHLDLADLDLGLPLEEEVLGRIFDESKIDNRKFNDRY